MYCCNCNKSFSSDKSYCSYCGKKLIDDTSKIATHPYLHDINKPKKKYKLFIGIGVGISIFAIIIFSIIGYFNLGSSDPYDSSYESGVYKDASQLTNGFYLKKGDEFHSINRITNCYDTFDNYLILENEQYYNILELESGDAIVFVHDEDTITSSNITYYEDLNFPTIGAAFVTVDSNKWDIRNTVGSAGALESYSYAVSLNGKSLDRNHEYFLGGLSEEEECNITCIKGTKTTAVKVTTDCHLLEAKLPTMRSFSANSNWSTTQNGYSILDTNFYNTTEDNIYDFSKKGYYKITSVIQGHHSQTTNTIFIKVK